MTGDRGEFDHRQPFAIDIGRAAQVAEELRKRGYPGCFADEVTADLAKPERERSVIGRDAAELLRSAGWRYGMVCERRWLSAQALCVSHDGVTLRVAACRWHHPRPERGHVHELTPTTRGSLPVPLNRVGSLARTRA
jgi:hypothetical protein